MVLPFAFLGLCSICLLWLLLKRRPLTKKDKTVSAVQEILQEPGLIQMNLHHLQTPSLSGYPLKIISYLYHTALGKLLSSSAMTKSNLHLFADLVIPEVPTLKYSPPLPPIDDREAVGTKNRNILISLMKTTRKHGQNNISDFYAVYDSGKATPLDVAHAVLAAIEDSNRGETPLRAIVACDRASVLSMAKASTERWKNGTQLSLLDGIPISLKEDFHTDLYACFCGATFVPEFAKNMPDSNVARRLLDAGAIIIGVTNMPELGTNSIGCSEIRMHKHPRNPFNIDFFPGGSSSGSAISVAAGLCPVAVAADGGGSGRVPAAVCGQFCLKMTHDRVHEVGSYSSIFSFSVLSPIGCSPLDIAIFMDALCNAEPGPSDQPSKPLSQMPFNLEAIKGNTKTAFCGVIIGVYWDWVEMADKTTVAEFRRAVEKLKLLGATVKEIKIPELEELRVAHVITTVGELSALISIDVEKNFHKIGPSSSIVSALGSQFSATECINAMKQRTRTITILKSLFKEVNVIATPTVGCPIARIAPEYQTAYGMMDSNTIGNLDIFTYCANFAGVPAITIPIGVLDEECGLPVGMQLIAPWNEEPELIKYALSMEASGQFPELKPKVWYDILNH